MRPVGISKFAVDQLTDLIMIDCRQSELASRRANFGEIESVKAVSDLYAPLTGEVVEVNAQVAGNVGLLAEDPYDKGWLIKVKVDQPVDTSGEKKELHSLCGNLEFAHL